MRTCVNHLVSDKRELESTQSPRGIGRAANPKRNRDVGQQSSIFVGKRTPNMDEQGDRIEGAKSKESRRVNLLLCHLAIAFKFLLENLVRLCAS